MKIFGDISEHDRSTADGLVRMEDLLVKKKYSKVNTAKGYVYIAAHWFILGMEEEGQKTIEKIYRICPDYFEKHLKKHMENPEFGTLMMSMFNQLVFLIGNKPNWFVGKK